MAKHSGDLELICLKEDLGKEIDIEYDGSGERLAVQFYIPLLKHCTQYDRATGYFDTYSLSLAATGMAHLIKIGGRMRLILGAHDIPEELIEAERIGREEAARILDEVGQQILKDLRTAEEMLASEKKRLEAVAWMLASGTLRVKVAIPRITYLRRGNGIFHQKRLIFMDEDGHGVAAIGSANETRAAYSINGENLSVFKNWIPGEKAHFERTRENFERLWRDQHPDFVIFPLPDAIKNEVHKRFKKPHPPSYDPVEEAQLELSALLAPAARMVTLLGEIAELSHMGLGPVVLYPHQAFAAEFTLSKFPHRVLLADEVGLGKTIEAGAVVKKLVELKRAERILVLAPKSLCRQWMEELNNKFQLPFWLLNTSPRKELVDPRGNKRPISEVENPFDLVDFLVASWHYARGSRRRQSALPEASPFDLIVVDEAHNARVSRGFRQHRPTRLNELCMTLSISTPHILLLTATPVQLYAAEAQDLLQILGLGGPWVHEANFRKFFRFVQNPEMAKKEDQVFTTRLVAWFSSRYVDPEAVRTIVKDHSESEEFTQKALQVFLRQEGIEPFVGGLREEQREALIRILYSLNPVQWFMVRNTRDWLKKKGYTFPKRMIKECEVTLDEEQQSLLERLDSYLLEYYGKYEKLISSRNRGVIGFVRSIYHQRFVSSLAAAYLTVKSRKEFLEALLQGNRDALLKIAEKFLEEEEWEEDEEALAEAAEELLQNRNAQPLIQRELNKVKELETDLQRYSPPVSDDPKFLEVHKRLRVLRDRGRKVLVFSKYTDTIYALRDFLPTMGLPPEKIALYTGDGGFLWSPRENDWKNVGKETVIDNLEEGQIEVVLCSGAARAGLNLQAASAVINVDMPWNPAKVEQRIGRVDRIGQKEKEVLVENVWYPNTIEGKMYSTLFKRADIYYLVVGPAQDIISQGLRKALGMGARGKKLKALVDETISQIEKRKEEMMGLQQAFEGAHWKTGHGYQKQLIDALRRFVNLAAKPVGGKTDIVRGRLYVAPPPGSANFPRDWNGMRLEPGVGNVLTPAHPIVHWLAEQIQRNAEEAGVLETIVQSIYAVRDQQGKVTFYTIDKNGVSSQLDGEQVIDLFSQLLDMAEGK